MKRVIWASLSILCLSIPLASSARAEGEAMGSKGGHCATAESARISPFHLVYRAYEGNFSAQGIPGGSLLLDAIALRQVTAQELVQGAIAQGRLSPDTINDRSYLKAVEFQMQDLGNSD